MDQGKHATTSRLRRAIRGSLVGLMLLLLVSALAARESVPEAAPGVRRVVVIHLDTTRVDDLGCYGGVARTPNIDAVAARGMRYASSITTAPKTSPSIASFMTGRLPNRHGVYDVGRALPGELTTLAEVLAANGFVTAGFTSNIIVDRLRSDMTRSAGFDQGFGVFEGIMKLPVPAEGVEANAIPRVQCDDVVRRALAFIERHRDDPFFLWMLHLDPHAPYAPPEPYASMYRDDPALAAGSVRLHPSQIHHQAYVSGRLDSHEYVARHLGEVTLTDHWIGMLLKKLNELPGRTLLVITADHGESLGDVGYWFAHGANIRHPTMNVPLIIACDGLVPAGESDALAANVDLAPTILELVGLSPAPLAADGRSLVPTFTEQDPWPDRMVPIQAYDGSKWRGVRTARFCLQSEMNRNTGQRSRSLLYDLAADPAETADVSDRFPEVLAGLRRFEDDWFRGPQATAADLSGDPEMRRRLESLGYVR